MAILQIVSNQPKVELFKFVFSGYVNPRRCKDFVSTPIPSLIDLEADTGVLPLNPSAPKMSWGAIFLLAILSS